MSDAPKDLYVSAVRGHLVSRPGSSVLIGAARDPREPSQITWDTEAVVRIPEAECRAFQREYARALRGGSLTRRSKEDFEASVKAQEAATEKAKAVADAAAKAEAKAPKSGKKE